MKFLLSKPFNLVAFNVVWISCVVGRESFIWIIAPLVLAYAALLVSTGSIKFSQVALPALIGILIDLLLSVSGVFQFPDNSPLLPFWLVILWIAFSITLTQSLSFLNKNIFVALFFGAVGFPLNYSVGERLGAVNFEESYLVTMAILCLIWAVLLPVLSQISSTRKGVYSVPV